MSACLSSSWTASDRAALMTKVRSERVTQRVPADSAFRNGQIRFEVFVELVVAGQDTYGCRVPYDGQRLGTVTHRPCSVGHPAEPRPIPALGIAMILSGAR